MYPDFQLLLQQFRKTLSFDSKSSDSYVKVDEGPRGQRFQQLIGAKSDRSRNFYNLRRKVFNSVFVAIGSFGRSDKRIGNLLMLFLLVLIC